jgi:hypothetical protein
MRNRRVFVQKEVAMGNGGTERNPWRTVFAQMVKIGQFLLDGSRDIEEVIKYLQPIIARPEFIKLLDAQPPAVKQRVQDLLVFVGTVRLPGISEPFKVGDRFVVDTSETARVKIYEVSTNFKRMFGKMTVGVCGESSLSYSMLKRHAYDNAIIAALGGEAKVVTTIAEVWQLMELQPGHLLGHLSRDEKAISFYVYDEEEVLRLVYVSRYNNAWGVNACNRDCSSWEPLRNFSHSCCSLTL